MTVNEAMDKFIIDRKLRGCSEKTLRNYREFNARFLSYVGNIDTAKLSFDLVQEYMIVIHERSVSKATKATYIRHLKAFLRWVSDEGGLVFPYKKIIVPKVGKKDVKIYSLDDVSLIFRSVKASPQWIADRNKCIVALMYDAGLRQSEVAGIMVDDIDYNARTIRVSGKGNKERKVPLGLHAERFVRKYLAECPYSEAYLFCEKDGSKMTANAVKKFVFKMNAVLPFEFSSHKLRHNFATNYCIDQYEEKGIMDPYSLMALLGHEDMQTTMRYLHLAQEIISCRKNISHLDKLDLA